MFRGLIRSSRTSSSSIRSLLKMSANTSVNTNANIESTASTAGSASVELARSTSTSTSVHTSTSSSALLDLINKTRKPTPVKQPLVWIDCEMTGLEVFKDDHIIEICCIITDGDLNIIDETGYESTVYYDKEVLDNMNEWCVTQHTKSGLVAKILDNPQQTLEKVNKELLEYVKKYIPQERVGILAGNSIHMDKFFLMKEFSSLVDHLHYRLVDVSSIMEFGYRHNPKLMKLYPKKKGNHTAKSDILESIEQLKWYKQHYFKDENEVKPLLEQYEAQQKSILQQQSEAQSEPSSHQITTNEQEGSGAEKSVEQARKNLNEKILKKRKI